MNLTEADALRLLLMARRGAKTIADRDWATELLLPDDEPKAAAPARGSRKPAKRTAAAKAPRAGKRARTSPETLAKRADGILAYLDKFKTGASSDTIANELGTTPVKLRLTLAKLKNDGLVKRTGVGVQSIWTRTAKKA